jgi:hypothetical protein
MIMYVQGWQRVTPGRLNNQHRLTFEGIVYVDADAL